MRSSAQVVDVYGFWREGRHLLAACSSFSFSDSGLKKKKDEVKRTYPNDPAPDPIMAKTGFLLGDARSSSRVAWNSEMTLRTLTSKCSTMSVRRTSRASG